MLDFLSYPIFQIAMPKTDSLFGGLTPTRISPRKVRRARRVASGSNNGGDAETRKDTGPKKKKRKTKHGKASGLISSARKRVPDIDPAVYIRSPVLLTTAIYRKNPVPEKYTDHYFRYVVDSYNARKKTYILLYDKQTILSDGLSYIADEHSKRGEKLEDIRISTVQDGVERYQQVMMRIHLHHRAQNK